MAYLALKLLQTILYAVNFCCSAVILGIYAYFLAVLSKHDMDIPQWQRAVTGLGGSGCLYLVFAVLLTCFLGGKALFAFLGIVFDLLFVGANVAIAVMARDGAHSCSGFVNTPLGNAPGSDDAPGAGSYTYVCRLNKVVFAVAIIGAGLFLISALIQLVLGRKHQTEKKYGPSPSNNYTTGSGSRWWGRRRGPRTTREAYGADPEYAPATNGNDIRPSHETGLTGSTASPLTGYTNDKVHGADGYHTAPIGSANPYGYERTPASNF